jgi:hypothetical protein
LGGCIEALTKLEESCLNFRETGSTDLGAADVPAATDADAAAADAAAAASESMQS